MTSDVWVGFSSVNQKPTLHSEPSYYFTPIRGSRIRGWEGVAKIKD